MANNSKYASMGKDALTAEIKARRSSGRKLTVDLRGDEDALRAALDTDDVENGEFPSAVNEPEPPLAGSGTLPPVPDANGPPAPPAPPESKEKPLRIPRTSTALGSSFRNQVAGAAAIAAHEPTQPSEEEWDEESEYYRHKGDGLVYEVLKRDSDAFNKPVKARVPIQESGHPGFFWEGTEADLVANFEKV